MFNLLAPAFRVVREPVNELAELFSVIRRALESLRDLFSVVRTRVTELAGAVQRVRKPARELAERLSVVREEVYDAWTIARPDSGRVVTAALIFFSQRIDGVCLTSTFVKPAARSICFSASIVGSAENS